MGTKTRTEIVVETHRVLAICRPCSSLEGWCARCGEQVRMILLTKAAFAGLSLQTIYQQARAGKLHHRRLGWVVLRLFQLINKIDLK